MFTLEGIIILTLTYNIYHKESYFNGDMIAQITGNYLLLVDKTISDSVFNDTFLCINIMIGLSMIIIGLLHSRKTISIKDKFLFIVENKKKLFIIGLTMLLAISALNMLLFILGLGITVDTSSVTLFLYTFFPKIIHIRLVLIFIICSITKEFKLDNLSLSLSSVIFMILLGCINYYYVMPYVEFIMFLGLTKLDDLLTRVYLVHNLAIITNSTQSLSEGIYNIITKFPIIGRFFNSFRSYDYNYNLSSPFRSSYNGIIKNKINIYPLTKISKFTIIDLFTKVENKVELFYSYKGNVINLEALLKNNSLYLSNLISSFVSNYTNLTCKINLICADEIVSIKTSFKNGHLEEFNLNRTNLNFANKVDKNPGSDLNFVNKVDENASTNLNFINSLLNTQFSKNSFDLCPKNIDSFDLCPKNIHSFYHPSVDRTKELFHLTDPMNNCYDLQVFMQKGFRNYDYNIQQGESSRQSLHPSNSNRGIKRPLDSENLDIGGSTDISTNYPCLDIRMIELQNKNYLFLDFDPEKLDSERDSYLYEICTIGRSVLFEHYSNWVEDKSMVRTLVDGVGFGDLSISDNIDGGYVKLYQAFYEKNLDIIKSHGIEPTNIHPFSKLYLEGNLDYPEDHYSEDGSSDDGDNLDNSNLDDGDHSNNYVSLGDSTQKGQEVLKSFEPKGNNDLIKWLRSKQRVYLNKYYSSSPNLNIKCTLYDLNLSYSGGVFSEKGRENEFTIMLTRLWTENPALFRKKSPVIDTNVNNLCYELRKLTPLYPEKFTNLLSKENINIFIEELKTRMRKVYFAYPAYTTKSYRLDTIHIKNLSGAIVEDPTFQENAFTEYIRLLVDKKPDLFYIGDYWVVSSAKLNNIYHGLIKLIREPLTKNEVTILINGLENRKNNIEFPIYMAKESESYSLRCFFIFLDDIILERDKDLEGHEFTRLLENFFIQKNYVNFKNRHSDLSIDRIIGELKEFIH